MIGLKAFIPRLSKELNIPEIALYERQRALVRAGLLEHTGGRGPGSGVRLTAESFAMLLTAILATTSLSETGTATRLLAKAKRSRISAEEEKGSLDGAQTFKDALVKAISSDAVASEVSILRVNRQNSVASFFHDEIAGRATQFLSGKKEVLTAFHELAELDIRAMRRVFSQLEIGTSKSGGKK